MLQPQALLLSKRKKKHQKGGSLVEIVVVAGIIMGSLAAILGLAAFFLATSHVVQQTSQATALAQEAMEVVRNYRDGTDWSAGLDSLTPGGPYHPEQAGGPPPAWGLAAGAETIDGFTREIMFEEVRRDSDANIVLSSGTVDASSTRAVATVSWQERGRTHEVELTAYFTNWRQ